MNTTVFGIKNVLEAVEKSGTVQRVVLTSSTTAVYHQTSDKKGAFDESDWNNKSTMKSNVYFAAKAAAERTAWEIKANSNQEWEMTSLLGSILVGASKHPRSSMTAMLSGVFKYGPNIITGWTDVEDFARLHVLAMEHKQAFPRVMCVNKVASMIEIGKIIKGRYKKRYPVTFTSLPKVCYLPFTSSTLRLFKIPFLPMLKHFLQNCDPDLQFDNSLLLDNFKGFEFKDISKSVVEMAESCITSGMVSYRRNFIFF